MQLQVTCMAIKNSQFHRLLHELYSGHKVTHCFGAVVGWYVFRCLCVRMLHATHVSLIGEDLARYIKCHRCRTSTYGLQDCSAYWWVCGSRASRGCVGVTNSANDTAGWLIQLLNETTLSNPPTAPPPRPSFHPSIPLCGEGKPRERGRRIELAFLQGITEW